MKLAQHDKCGGSWEDFVLKYGETVSENLLQTICEAIYADRNENGVRIIDKCRHDAINCTATGILEHDGQEFKFVIEDGDWNGTVIREWGDPETVADYEHPKPPVYDMVPTNPNLKEERPAMWGVYLIWKTQEWFQEILKDYAYDRHFAPGSKTEQYYREKAAQKGLRIVRSEESNG